MTLEDANQYKNLMTEAFGSHSLTNRPSLTEPETAIVDQILQFPEGIDTPEQQAAHLLAHITRTDEPLSLKQKVYTLMEINDDVFLEVEKQVRHAKEAALAGMEMGLYTQHMNGEEYIRTKSMLHGTPLFLVAASIRRDLALVGGYPDEWDTELEELSGFQPNDDLPRLEDGHKISYQNAVEKKRAKVSYDFARQIHDEAARNQNPIPATPRNVFQRYIDYATKLPQKPGNDITLEDVISGVEDFAARFGGNQQIADMCQGIVQIVEIILEQKDGQGNIRLEDLPQEPEITYPQFKTQRGRTYHPHHPRQRRKPLI